MNTYAMMAFEVTRSQHMSADEVAAMDYADIAELAKAKVEVNGDSPADFHYKPVRRKVCELLLMKEHDDKLEAIRAAAENAAKLQAELSDLTLTVDIDGRLRVTSAKVSSDTEDTTFTETVHAWLEAKGVNK